jgi:transposase-like protein
MKCQKLNRAIDGITFRCTKCKKRISIRTGTYWVDSNLTARQIILLLYFWANKATNAQISEYIDISPRVCVDYLNFIREICSWKILQESKQLGGEGQIVQLDESVIYKPKYNLGAGFKTPAKWIFALYDVTRKIAYVEFVEKRNAETLLPIIKRWVKPGTEIHTDCWAAYNKIYSMDVSPPFLHKTVNHSQNFVDPESKAHTNNVEAYWSSVKRKFKILNGTSRAMTASYLDEHMYLQKYGGSSELAFRNILLHIAEYSLVD